MIKIVLNSTFELDGINPDSPFVITLEESSFETLTARGSSFSNLVEFAKTAANIRFFGSFDNFNIQVSTPYTLYDADVYDDDLLLFSGVFKLMETNHTFKGRVFGASAGLFDILKGVSIQSLDLSALNHTWNAATVNSNRQNTTGFVYPNINYGQWTGETHAASGVPFTDFYPAVYIDDILEAACTYAGYTYTKLGSDFIIPFCNKEFQQISGLVGSAIKTTDDILLVAASEIPIPFASITNDPNNIFTYTTSGADRTTISLNKGVYEISGTLIYDADGGNVDDITIGAYLSSGIFYAGIITVAPGESGTYDYQLTVEQSSNTTADFRLAIDGDTNGDSITIETGSTLVLDSGTRSLTSSDTVPVADILPDLNSIDLFKYMAIRYNALMIADNQAKTFEFVAFNDIAADFANALDWSQKVMNDDSVRTLFHLDQYAQSNFLQYEEQPSDDPSRNVSQIGRGTLSISDTTLEGQKILYTAPFCRSAIFEGFSNKSAMIFIPRYSDPSVDYRSPDIDPDLRVLRSVIDASISVTVTGTTAPATQCNSVFVPFSTDITDYYGAFSTALDKCKVIEVDLQLNNFDIQLFDITQVVFLLEAYWFVLKVDQFRVGDYAPTKVKLLKLY